VGTFIGIVVLIAIVALGFAVSRARTSARKASNATVRTSLSMTSSRSPADLADIIVRGLAGVGLSETGSFDGTRFFGLNNLTQLELKVWSEDSQSHARLHLPSVRSQSGRPQRLGPVGNALAAVERSVRGADQTATIS
jgi:hypothetical protein